MTSKVDLWTKNKTKAKTKTSTSGLAFVSTHSHAHTYVHMHPETGTCTLTLIASRFYYIQPHDAAGSSLPWGFVAADWDHLKASLPLCPCCSRQPRTMLWATTPDGIRVDCSTHTPGPITTGFH